MSFRAFQAGARRPGDSVLGAATRRRTWFVTGICRPRSLAAWLHLGGAQGRIGSFSQGDYLRRCTLERPFHAASLVCDRSTIALVVENFAGEARHMARAKFGELPTAAGHKLLKLVVSKIGGQAAAGLTKYVSMPASKSVIGPLACAYDTTTA
jgi:hypothetical protein